MQALFLLKSQAEIGQGQALQSFNMQHWQNVDITILVSITIFCSMPVSAQKQVYTHFHVCLSLTKPTDRVVGTSNYFTPSLWTAHCKSDLTKPPAKHCTNILSCQHMSVRSGCNFSARRLWDKTVSCLKKFKKIVRWLSFLQRFLVWRI